MNEIIQQEIEMMVADKIQLFMADMVDLVAQKVVGLAEERTEERLKNNMKPYVQML